jgi:hypothetical protein
MRLTPAAAACAVLLAAPVAILGAQTCLGYPALATGPLNVTGSVSIGTEWWGGNAHVNLGPQRGPYFAGASLGAIRFVDDPVESRLSWGVLGGFDWMSRGLLHACPFLTAAFEQGDFVTRLSGERTKIHGRVLGVGVAFAGESQNRRFESLSFAPFFSARLTQIVTFEDIEGEGRIETDETGASVVAGLGFRFRDAFQVTPTFATSTFENADLVFTLRVSIALERR